MAEYDLQAFKSDTLAVQLLSTAGAGDTFTLSSGNFTDTPAGMYSILALEPKVTAKREIISCTISGSTVTIIARGVDGTSAVQHEINAAVIMAFTPTHYTAIKTGAAQALKDGWQSFGKTLTYQSPTTVSGTDFLANNRIGDPFKCDQEVSLTAYFPFEDKDPDVGSFTVANVGTPTYTAGKFGNALTLNGTDQALAITDAALLKPTGAFTIGAWFKTSSAGAVKRIFQSCSANTNWAGILLQVGITNKLEAYSSKNTSTSDPVLVGTTTVTDGNWHYAVFAWQGNHGKIFLDGNLEASGYMNTPAYAATNYVRIGCANDTGSNVSWFNGQIDDLFFINGHAVDQYWVATKYATATAQGTANITATYKGNITAVADTLLTMNGGADYALYNGAITSPYYSHSNPVGFPDYFTYIPTTWKNDYTTALASTIFGTEFKLSGRKVSGNIVLTGIGDPSGNKIVITLPIAAKNLNYDRVVGAGYLASSGAGMGKLVIQAGVTAKVACLNTAESSWSASNNTINMPFEYEI